MRKLYSFLAGIIGVILLLATLSFILQKKTSSASQSDKLVIYNWGDYIDPALLKNSPRKPVSRFSMRPLIPMKPCTLRSNKVEQPMTLLFRVITRLTR